MSPDTVKLAALKILAETPVRAGQVWRQVETGDRMFVMAVGLDEATYMPTVVFSGPDHVVWTRLLAVFLSKKDGNWRYVNDDDESVMIAAAHAIGLP